MHSSNLFVVTLFTCLPFMSYSWTGYGSEINVIDADFSAGFTDTGAGDRNLETELDLGWHGEISNGSEKWDLSGGYARFKDSAGRAFSQAITITGNNYGNNYHLNFEVRTASLSSGNTNQDLYLHVICWNTGDTAPLVDDQTNNVNGLRVGYFGGRSSTSWRSIVHHWRKNFNC
jgi:hypothetical protein